MRDALRHRSFVVGALLVALLFAAALVSLAWTPHSPFEMDIPAKLGRPSAAHWLGTDSLGRDVASLLLVGAQNSIAVGFIAVGIGLVCGVSLGLLASAERGWVEEAVMRFSDFTFAFPSLLSAIMLTALYGPGLAISIVAIGIFNVPVFARITRAQGNAVWTRDYVLAARAAGKGRLRITFEHVLPNIASVLIVQAPLAGQAPLLAVFPGLAIALSVLGLNLMGDGLRDLLDPKLARKR
jgi:peptide/nickel transport system permease protein